jgi:hypothetical protein
VLSVRTRIIEQIEKEERKGDERKGKERRDEYLGLSRVCDRIIERQVIFSFFLSEES